ncbi:hypothetical protein [Streptomyces misionensis]|uniref:hypothetical protein n=1 Tax=Streptomyces misionensis TaxID=67331 RepID=UPI0033B35C6D
MTRRIDTNTPNSVMADPATVAACQRDLGSPQDRADRADAAARQSEATSKVIAERSEVWGGRQ